MSLASEALNTSSLKQVRKESWLAAALTVTLWASAFAGIRVGLRSYSPESVALLRYLTASLSLALYALATRMPLPARRDVPVIAALGFLGFSAYNVALNAGEVRVPAGMASFIIASEPVWMALLAAAWWGEQLNRRGWGGILLSFSGVAVISFAAGGDLRLDPAVLLIVLAALVKTIYSVGQRKSLKTYGALQFVTYAIWAGTCFLLVFSPGLVREMHAASLESTLAVVYMGIFPGAIAYVSWSVVLSRLPAARAGSVLYLIPALAALIAWVWLGEVPSIFALVGGLLIVAGVMIVNKRGR